MDFGSARSLLPVPNFLMEAMVLNFRTLLAIVIAAVVIGAIILFAVILDMAQKKKRV